MIIAKLLMNLAIMFAIPGLLSAQAPDEQAKEVQRTGYTLSGPYTHQNLTVFLVHGADRIKDKVYLTLSEALEQKKAIVHETKEVQELAIENLSADEILIQSGDIVKGGQQDRILAMDLIVPAKSGKEPVKVAIASFCCEAGRWAPRGTEEVARFAPGNFQAATKDLKVAVRSQRAQQAVWDNVSRAQMKAGFNLNKSVQKPESASSLQLSLEDKDFQKAVNGYVDLLQKVPHGKNDAIGYVSVVNGRINSADVYVSNALFQKVWPTLLRGSAIEAFCELKKDQKFDQIKADAVKTFLEDAEKGKSVSKDITKRVVLVEHDSEKSILFETRDRNHQSAMIRRSYIAK